MLPSSVRCKSVMRQWRRDVHAVPQQVAKLVKDGHAKVMGKNARGEMTYLLILKEGEVPEC